MSEKIVNVTFGSSDCGTIKMFTYEKNKPREEHVCLDLDLNIGYIGKDFFKGREEVLGMMFKPFGCNDEEVKEIVSERLSAVDEIIEKAKKGFTIRVWISNGSYVKCGYCYLISKLVDIPCKVEEYYTDIDSWSQLDYSRKELIKPKITIPSKEKIEKYAQNWVDLEKENNFIRIIEKEMIRSVPIDYYDRIICELMPDKEITTVTLCGKVLGAVEGYIESYFILDRIDKLIEKGVFEKKGIVKNSQPQNAKIVKNRKRI